MADGDTITVYVSTADSRESAYVPGNVHAAAVRRSEARSRRNYAEADALHQQIIDSGYRLVCSSFLILNVKCSHHYINFFKWFVIVVIFRMIAHQNEEILAKKYRIRLR